MDRATTRCRRTATCPRASLRRPRVQHSGTPEHNNSRERARPTITAGRSEKLLTQRSLLPACCQRRHPPATAGKHTNPGRCARAYGHRDGSSDPPAQPSLPNRRNFPSASDHCVGDRNRRRSASFACVNRRSATKMTRVLCRENHNMRVCAVAKRRL